MKSYLIAYKYNRKSNSGMVIEGMLGFDGSLQLPQFPSQAEVLGLIGLNRQDSKQYNLIWVSVTELPEDWLTDEDIVA